VDVKTDRILFVSHRWREANHPDPTGVDLRILQHFLRKGGPGEKVRYLWLDYCCLQQADSSERNLQLMNVPTALWASHIMLIIPQVVAVPDKWGMGESQAVSASNLGDYVDRSWCLMEVIGALLTRSLIYCSFLTGEVVCHERFERPECCSSYLGFNHAEVRVWNHLQDRRAEGFLACDRDALREIRDVVEPVKVAGLLLSICTAKGPEIQYIRQKTMVMSVRMADVVKHSNLRDLWNLLGSCRRGEADKLIVLNLLLFMGFARMSIQGHQGTDANDVEQTAGCHDPNCDIM